MLILAEPALEYKDALLDAVLEFHAAGEYDVTAEQQGAQWEEGDPQTGYRQRPRQHAAR